jgi:hypothetical protein
MTLLNLAEISQTDGPPYTTIRTKLVSLSFRLHRNIFGCIHKNIITVLKFVIVKFIFGSPYRILVIRKPSSQLGNIRKELDDK